MRTIKKIFNTTVSVKEGAGRTVLRGIIQHDTLNEVNIRLSDGTKAFDYSGYTKIVFKVLKADGTSFVDSEGENVIATSPEDGVVTVILKGQATAAAGLCQSVIEIYDGGDKMTTARLNYEVFEALGTDEEAESESRYPVFQNLMMDLSALEKSIENAETERVDAEAERAEAEAKREKAEAERAEADKLRLEKDMTVSASFVAGDSHDAGVQKTLNEDGSVNLHFNLPAAEGTGDMMGGTYDPQGKGKDIFRYAEETAEKVAAEQDEKLGAAVAHLEGKDPFILTYGAGNWNTFDEAVEAYNAGRPVILHRWSGDKLHQSSLSMTDYTNTYDVLIFREPMEYGNSTNCRFMRRKDDGSVEWKMENKYPDAERMGVVKKTGDTMTGNLTISKDAPIIKLQDGAAVSSVAMSSDGNALYMKKDTNGDAPAVELRLLSSQPMKSAVQFKYAGSSYNILHTGNKSTGYYTGNGSAAERRIDIGGYGAAVIIDSEYGGALLFNTHGVKLFGNGGSAGTIAYTTAHFYNGTIILNTADSFLNENGVEYHYSVL